MVAPFCVLCVNLAPSRPTAETRWAYGSKTALLQSAQKKFHAQGVSSILKTMRRPTDLEIHSPDENLYLI